jgi:hypothetical protein
MVRQTWAAVQEGGSVGQMQGGVARGAGAAAACTERRLHSAARGRARGVVGARGAGRRDSKESWGS